ncbi:type 1 glutamine amidotransferase domain-containing protein [Pleurocapsales cyanobacterium LEGE 06147]|nr:type 1 glutamine amidotransferase domain-containing protein [Pleurocapsales cyanobacterium LEGE 06147]
MKNILISLFSRALVSLPEQPSPTARSMGRVLMVVSNTNTLQLKDNRVVSTGYYLNELTVPAQYLLEAGYEVVVATPSGKKPVIDAHSNNMSFFGYDQAAWQRALTFVDTYPSLQNPKTLKTVVSEGLERYLGVYVPGDRAAMNDLMQDADFGQILEYLHQKSQPTAFPGHGSVAMLTTLPNAVAYRKALVDGDEETAKTASVDWQYAGYRMTSFSNEEEYVVESEIFKGQVPFYVADALKSLGGRVEHGPSYRSFVVHNRELLAGQNPSSARAIAQEFVEALDEARVMPTWVRKYCLGHA